MTRSSLATRIAVVLGCAAATPGTGGATAAVTPGTCRPAAIEARLVAAKKVTRRDIKEFGIGVEQVRCADLTRDGRRDALFTVASGGTAGAIKWGLIQSRGSGKAGRLAAYRNGYKTGIAVRSARAEVLTPIYAEDDANCCPSAFAIATFAWNGRTLAKRGRSQRVPKVPPRFFVD